MICPAELRKQGESLTVNRFVPIEGNTQKLDGGAMFGNAPRALWQRWMKPDDGNRIPLSCRSFLIEINDEKILLEAGIGAFFDPKMKDRFGVVESEHMLLKNLEAVGVAEADISMVILSHLHFDHAGGLLPKYGDTSERLLFPNAKYVVSEKAFDRSLAPHFRDKASYIPGLADKLEASGRLIKVTGSSHDEVYPDLIRFKYTDGHTPGQLHSIINFGEEFLFFAGDLIPGCAWIHLPITMGYDRFAEKVIDEKQNLYESEPLDKLRLIFTHDPHNFSAKVRKTENGKFEAWEMQET